MPEAGSDRRRRWPRPVARRRGLEDELPGGIRQRAGDPPLLDRDAALDILPDLHERFCRIQPGAITRSRTAWELFLLPVGEKALQRFQLLGEAGHISRQLFLRASQAYDFQMHLRLVHQQAYVDWLYRAYQGGLRLVCCAAVNNIMEARRSPDYRAVMDQADLVTSDGMPLVWLARLLDNHEKVLEIILPTLKEENRATWSPFFPKCARCGRVYTTRVTGYRRAWHFHAPHGRGPSPHSPA